MPAAGSSGPARGQNRQQTARIPEFVAVVSTRSNLGEVFLPVAASRSTGIERLSLRCHMAEVNRMASAVRRDDVRVHTAVERLDILRPSPSMIIAWMNVSEWNPPVPSPTPSS